MKCEVCKKKEATAQGYGKHVCSTECFREAAKTYDPSKSSGAPLCCRD